MILWESEKNNVIFGGIFMYLFDLDGTLLDSSGVWRQIDIDFLAKRGLPWTEEYNEGVIHTIFPLAAQFTKEYGNLPDSVESIMEEWHSMALEQYARHIPLKPFVKEFLEQCAKNHIPMALYTSCEPILCEAALKHHGIEPYFSQVVYAARLGMEKRSPAAFAAALDCLGVSADQCLFFDDSPVSCAGAKEAGLKVVGVHDRLFAQEEETLRGLCDQYIINFGELLD
jgi:HAD superfamily hydrolase (TIGR01509 family)